MTDIIPSDRAKQMACDEANAVLDINYWKASDVVPGVSALYALALRIERTEGPFEDPDLVDARTIVAAHWRAKGFTPFANAVDAGHCDEGSDVSTTLAGIKHGRKQS